MPNVNLNTTPLNLVDAGDRINITIALEGDDPDDDPTFGLSVGLSTRIKDIVPTLANWSCWKKLPGC